ncbi:MAG TPA: hypothetical protein VLM40_16405 [Gemmata sp.]|nr:hypothetical protein [Gemmata sp.]
MTQFPYGLIALGAVIWLTSEYARTATASVRSKRLLTGLAIASVVVASYRPLIGIAAQLAICGYILVYQIVASNADRDSPP